MPTVPQITPGHCFDPALRAVRSEAADANVQIVQRESELSGMGRLLNPRSLLPSVSKLFGGSAPTSIRLNYLRYKPRRRCIALLEVSANDRTEFFTATAMTAGSWYRRQNKQTRSAAANSLPVPDGHLYLELFPADRYLRHAAKLFDSQSRDRLLRRILPADAEICPQITSELRTGTGVQIDRLAYKPARRLVVSVGVADVPRYVIKFHSTTGFSAAAQRLPFALMRPLPDIVPTHCCERYGAVATEWVSGRNLNTLFDCSPDIGGRSVLAETGRRLAELHACRLPSGVSLPVRRTVAVMAELRRLQEDLVFLYPPAAGEICRVIAAAAESLPAEETFTLIHGDFYAKQVIVSDHAVRFIDFDAVSIGNPWQDVGNFVAKLHWDHIRGRLSDNGLQTSVSEFLNGYRGQRPTDEQAGRCWLAIALLQCLPHTFRQAADDWPILFGRLLKLAGEALIGRTPKEAFVPACTPAGEAQREPVESPLSVSRRVRSALQHPTTRLEFPLPRLRFLEAQTVRMKPNRRCLLECSFVGDLSPARFNTDQAQDDVLKVLGKIRYRGIDRHTPELHRKLATAGFHRNPLVRIPRYLGTVPSMNMWLQEKVPAHTVTPDVLTPTKTHADIGRALAALHASGVCVDRRHGIDDEMAILHQRLGEVSHHYPEWSQGIGRILKRCDRLAASLPPAATCLLHRDFYFDQVLFDGSQITLLDLDLAAMGPPELDAGNYIAHLLEYGLRSPADAENCHRAARVFEQAYLAAGPAAQPSAVSAWTTISLARHISVANLFADRRHTIPKLLEVLTAASGNRTPSVLLF
ncbi:MAG: aminoglycoside phosphotransferase family protein [Planctomycetaceae bacterium]|nr:aminoglycoside phosphotransferase family protein [Planctomycetaceae bacterium]